MNHQPQQPVSACTLAIGMGATMGAGIGGSAGVCIGGFTGFFSGYRGMSLIKHAGKWVLNQFILSKPSFLGVRWPWAVRLRWWCLSHRDCELVWMIENAWLAYLLVQFCPDYIYDFKSDTRYYFRWFLPREHGKQCFGSLFGPYRNGQIYSRTHS